MRPDSGEGVLLLEGALRKGRAGSYQIQAAIAAVHAEAERWQDTDWHQIVLLYDTLLTFTASPVVELNRAVALAMHRGPGAGLAQVDELARRGDLENYVYLHATRADLLRRLGRAEAARISYRRAIELAGNAAERAFLEGRLRDVEGS